MGIRIFDFVFLKDSSVPRATKWGGASGDTANSKVAWHGNYPSLLKGVSSVRS